MSGQLGLGAMIGMLSGNEDTVKSFKASIGKKITALELKDDQLVFTFKDGSVLRMFDDGQSCCESRWMNTDDKLENFVGGKLLDASIEDAPSPKQDDEYDDYHDVQFLHVKTSKGSFTMQTHNHHNGYYGGFIIRARVEGLRECEQ